MNDERWLQFYGGPWDGELMAFPNGPIGWCEIPVEWCETPAGSNRHVDSEGKIAFDVYVYKFESGKFLYAGKRTCSRASRTDPKNFGSN